MSFTISSRNTAGVAVLDLNGRIVLGEETKRLEETLRDLAGRGEKKILLNLADVTYIDSSGLGALVRSHMAVTELEGQIKLLNVPAKVQTLLKITKLHTLFELYDTEAAAIESFR